MQYLDLGADRAGRNKVINVLPEVGPPELALQKRHGASSARVTGELPRVSPLKNLGMNWGRHEETSVGTVVTLRNPLGLC